MTRSALIIPALVAFLIVGCTSVEAPESRPSSSGPSADWTPLPKSARPTADPRTSPPAPAPAVEATADATVYVTKVEFLGSAKATVVYNREGTQRQENVSLPYEHIYGGGTYDLSDPYLAAGTVSLSGEGVGCRITVNNVIVDEILPTSAQTSVLCDTNS